MQVSVAITISKVIGGITTFCLARMLVPAEYGFWSTLTLITSLSTILLLGSVETLVKQVPYYLGKSDDHLVRQTEGGVLASVFFSSGALLVFAAALFFTGSLFADRATPGYIQFTLITAAVSLFSCYYYYRLSAYSRFEQVSVLNSARAAFTFVLVVSFGWRWHLMGMVAGALCAEALILALSMQLNKKLGRPMTICFNRAVLWNIIKVGFPITMVWWAYVVLTSVDRLISISMLGKTLTGYYSLGSSIVSLIILIPAAVSQVLYPQVSRRIGANAAHQEILRVVVFPARVLSLTVPLVLGALSFLTPFIIKTIFPRYEPGIAPAQVLLLGAFFFCFTKNGVNYLVAIDKQLAVFGYVIVSLITTAAATIAAIKMGFSTVGVSAGTVIGCFMLTTLVWTSVFKNLGRSPAGSAGNLFGLYLPFLIMAAGIFVTTFATGRFSGQHKEILAAVNIVLFSTIYCAAVFSIPSLRALCRSLFHELRPGSITSAAAEESRP